MDMSRPAVPLLEYPGRLIVLGRARGRAGILAVYAITGRSPSSQARKLVCRDGGVWVEPTDERVLSQGRVELLIYPAMLFGRSGSAVSNGRQTGDILSALRPGADPIAVLSEAMSKWDYEPDAPIFTPRIGGCLLADAAALCVVRRGEDGEAHRSYFGVPLLEGVGWLVSTYEGPNKDPLPSFCGEPRRFEMGATTAREAAEIVYRQLGPLREGGPDFRVAVAAALLSSVRPEDIEVHIINRHERT